MLSSTYTFDTIKVWILDRAFWVKEYNFYIQHYLIVFHLYAVFIFLRNLWNICFECIEEEQKFLYVRFETQNLNEI